MPSEFPEIPEIQKPESPERHRIEIWPGKPPESSPIPLEGRPYRVEDLPEELSREPKLNPDGARGGNPNNPNPPSGAGTRGGNPNNPNPPFGTGTRGDGSKSDKFSNSLPSVDEISTYWSFRNSNNWGIAVSKNGLYQYAYCIQENDLSLTHIQAVNVARTFIVEHQVHHFLIDRAVCTLEAALSISGGTNRGYSHWEKFHSKLRGSRVKYSSLEESLSCAYARRQLKKGESTTGFATLLGHQPPGYQLMSDDGSKIETSAGPVSHQQAVSELLSEYIRDRNGRALGLHGLMLYKNHLKGTNGDHYFAIDGKKIELPVHYAP